MVVGAVVVKSSVIVLDTVVGKGVVVGVGVVVVVHGDVSLTTVPFSPHVAVIQLPSPSVVL